MLVYGVFRQKDLNSAQTLIALYKDRQRAEQAVEVYQSYHEDYVFKMSIIEVLD